MSKKKNTSDTTLQALVRNNRRGVLTFWRIVKYGLASFTRNAWLSIAATAIMIVTLLVISVTLIARNVMNDTVIDFKSRVNMSIYVQQGIPSSDIDKILASIQDLPSVRGVHYISPEEAKRDYITMVRDNPTWLEALGEATNKMPGIFNIEMTDINDSNLAELEHLVETNELVSSSLDPDRAPSFMSDKRAPIDTIANVASFIETAGIILGAIFVVIASLVIFNTIRMAIFNRREEIYMMKLIGADKSFIRGPFIIEAIQYGLIASIITTIVASVVLTTVSDKLDTYGIITQPTIDILSAYWPIALIGLALIGALIGVVSSFFATRKYLKLLQ